jgi:DNA primase
MDQTSQIRERIDIVSFISEFIAVKKAGRNFSALCPFHGEKTPSFMISPERQRWHCFGCQKSGDCFTFIMEYEHMDFLEALRFLAKKTGVELQNNSFNTGLSSKKEVLYKINALAAEYYHYLLTKHAVGKHALAYVLGRGIDPRLLETFKLGFSPIRGNGLTQYLHKKKQFAAEDLIESGLVLAKDRDIFDFFRGRLMFPLIDHRENVIGFSGRLLDENTGFGGKYINTRDTLVYHKREHFFGLNVTRENIYKAKQAILVEGEFDVMSCFQHGIANVVAVKGTALTDQQVNLLSRYAEKVTICFDGDRAGQEAIKRSLPILEKKGLTTTVIVIPSGKDPDESLKANPGEFKKAADHDVNIYDYLFDQTVKQYPASTPDGKRKISEALLPIISGIQNAIVREHYLRKLSQAIETTYESITKELDKLSKKEFTVVKVPIAKIERSREEILEEYLIALILQNNRPKDAFKKAMDILSDCMAKERAYQKIISHLLDYFEEAEGFDHKLFADNLPSELHDAYNTTLLFPLPQLQEDKHTQEVEKVAKQLRAVYLKEKIKLLTEQIKEKEREGKEEEAKGLKEEYSRMVGLLKK